MHTLALHVSSSLSLYTISKTIQGKDWVCFLEGVLCVLCSYGWHDIFISCCHASLLGLVDILEHFLHCLDRELFNLVSKT